MNADDLIQLEIVYGSPERQSLVALSVRRGTTCAEAIRESGLSASFPGDNLDSLPIAIWGKVVKEDDVVAEGDRIEILRPLEIDPRDARRQLARDGGTMGGSGRDRSRNSPSSKIFS